MGVGVGVGVGGVVGQQPLKQVGAEEEGVGVAPGQQQPVWGRRLSLWQRHARAGWCD